MNNDIKPGEKVLVEATAEEPPTPLGQWIRVNGVSVIVPSADAHRASDFLRPKFRVGDEVVTERSGPRKVRDTLIEYEIGLGDVPEWIEEFQLQPAPVKTPLDEARDDLKRAIESHRVSECDSPSVAVGLEHAITLLSELERRERLVGWLSDGGVGEGAEAVERALR